MTRNHTPIGLPAPVVGWIRNHAVKNYWRVAGVYELDDLIQDGLLKAYQCRKRYGLPGGPDCPSCESTESRIRFVRQGRREIAVNVCLACSTRYLDRPHFMALVKTSFHRHIAELLRTKRGLDDVTIKVGDIDPDRADKTVVAKLAGVTEPVQELAVLVAELPVKLRRVVEFYVRDDPTRLWRNLRVRLDGADETLSDRLYRLTGFPKDEDFEAELRASLQ